MTGRPGVIIYVPGMKPKPEPEIQRAALWRCMIEGLRRTRPAVARRLAAAEDRFDVIAWTYHFYHEDHDF